MVVFPAPDGPTRATMWPGSTVKETSWRTSLRWPASSTATDSSEASETSPALGYVKSTSSNAMEALPRGTSTASGSSSIMGSMSSTSKMRSKETRAVMTSRLTFESWVSGW